MLDAGFQGKLCGIAFAMLKSGLSQKEILQGMIAIQTKVNAQLAAAPVSAQEDTRLRDMEIERDTLRHGLRLANERIADLTAPAQGERQPFVFDKRQALSDAAEKVRAEQAAQGERQPGWQPITAPGQVKAGTKLRFTIGDDKYSETAKLILHPGTDKEEIIYNKRQNYYLITSMSIANKGSQRNVEFLG